MTESQKTPRLRSYATWIPLALAAMILVIAVGFVVHPWSDHGNVATNAPDGALTMAEQVNQAAAMSMREHKYDEAIHLMVTYIARYPQDVEVRPMLAQAFMAKGENPKAEIVVDQVLLRSPHLARVLWLKGELVRRRGQLNAMFYFRKAVEDSADVTPEYWSMFGRELLAVNQTAEARKWLERAHNNGCKDGQTLRALGEARLSNKEYAQAREVLELASVQMPNDPHVSLLLATACRNLKDLKTAADILTTTLLEHPDPELYMELGETRLLQKRPLEAADAFEEATHFTKYDQRAQAARKAAEIYYKYREILYRDRLNLDAAADMIKIAIELRPFDVEIQQLRTKVLQAASRP
jgi:tetratricopeptide (TPR) repeat protein